VYLAIATLGFGLLLEQLVYPMSFMFHTDQSGIPTPRPAGNLGGWHFATDTGFYYVLLVLVVVVVLALQALRSRPLGRVLRAMRDSPVALQTQGTSTRVALVVVFCLSAFLAGVSGALTASRSGFAVGSDYSSFASLLLFATVVVVGVSDPWNALIGAAALTLIPSYLTSGSVNTYLRLAFGLAAIAAVYVQRKPFQMPAPVARAIDAMWKRPRGVATVAPHRLADTSTDPKKNNGIGRSGVEVKRLHVRFGAVVAVNGVTIQASAGRITGLIGPNGAGKTTTFNACSGLVKAGSGEVHLNGRSITHLSSPRRAVRGLGRTFQNPQLFDSLSVRDNVALGAEAFLLGRHPTRLLRSGRGHRRAVNAAAQEAIEFVGIEEITAVQAGALSVGQRRLVELARCIAAPFDMLLLDEPSAGLDRDETVRFGQLLRRMIAERGVGMLLVEHDMDLVRTVCDHVYVMDFGTLIFEGSPTEMEVSATVRAAYLGADLPTAEADVPASPTTGSAVPI